MNIFIKIAEGAGSSAEFVCKNYCQVARIIVFVKKIMNIVFFIVPMLLIVMLTFDFFKNVISGSEDEVKKNTSLAIKRIIAAIILFLIPHIINTTASALEYAGVKGAKLYRLATEENLDTDIFNQLEKEFPESPEVPESTNQAISSYQKNKKYISTSKSYILTNNNIILGQYSKKINKYTIKLTNKKGATIDNNKFQFKSSNPAIAKVSSSGVVSARFGGKTTITITSKDSKEKLTANVNVVHSLYTYAKTTKSITTKELVSGKTTKLSSGTSGILNGIGPSKYGDSYPKGNILKVGNKYYEVTIDSVKAYKYYIEKEYSKSIVENFVNSFGFSSDTKYLLWSNHGTQRLYTFKGSKGKWKLISLGSGLSPAIPIGTGDVLGFVYNECKSGNGCSTGIRLNNKIGNTFTREGYSKKLISKKGNPLHQNFGKKIGTPLSHGCTRVKNIDNLLNVHSKIKNCRYIDY